MFKFFKKKTNCKWSELPHVSDLTDEMARGRANAIKENRQMIIDTIQSRVRMGKSSCTFCLSSDDITWLKEKGYTVERWDPDIDNTLFVVSWGED